jgi:hypothetical protein
MSLTDLLSTLDKRSLSGIGYALGEPEQSVSRAMQTAVATLLGGLASKSDNRTLIAEYWIWRRPASKASHGPISRAVLPISILPL